MIRIGCCRLLRYSRRWCISCAIVCRTTCHLKPNFPSSSADRSLCSVTSTIEISSPAELRCDAISSTKFLWDTTLTGSPLLTNPRTNERTHLIMPDGLIPAPLCPNIFRSELSPYFRHVCFVAGPRYLSGYLLSWHRMADKLRIRLCGRQNSPMSDVFPTNETAADSEAGPIRQWLCGFLSANPGQRRECICQLRENHIRKKEWFFPSATVLLSQFSRKRSNFWRS